MQGLATTAACSSKTIDPIDAGAALQDASSSSRADASSADARVAPDTGVDAPANLDGALSSLGTALADAGPSHNGGDASIESPRDGGGDATLVAVHATSDAGGGPADAHGGTGPLDGGSGGHPPAMDASAGDAAAGTPALLYIGRFDLSDPAGPQMGWPGTAIVARFDGTSAAVQLTQTDGYSGGPSWFNVVVDGVASAPFSLEGASVSVPLASGLAPGVHVVTLEKRTEANLGTVRFEGFTFAGGTGLLAPPARAAHRIEIMSDSTIDGFGVLGDMATTCPTGDPPQYNDSRSSLGFFTSSASNAEMVLSAYSGKGLVLNEDPQDTEYYEDLYPRALPDSPSSTWSFTKDIPDAVVMSLGGVDMDGQSAAPPGFEAAYDALVGQVRGYYPSAAIWLTVWSQITDSPIATRTAMTNTLQSIVTARTMAGDHNLFLYVFPEATAADETGCEGHANVAHEHAMATLMASAIEQQLGW